MFESRDKSAAKLHNSVIDFWATVCKTVCFALRYRTVVCPVCDVGVLWPNSTAAWIKMKLGMEVGLGPGHIVLDGNPSPKKGGTASFPKKLGMSVLAKRLDGSKCHLVRR